MRETTIGFRAVQALLAGRVAAATAFWNVEGVALQARRPGIREFRVDDYGAPAYPELVLAVTRRTLDERRAVVRAAIRALRRGYGEAQIDPESAIAGDGRGRAAARPRRRSRRRSTRSRPPGRAGVRVSASWTRRCCARWAAWDLRFGILERPLDVERRSTPRWSRASATRSAGLRGEQALDQRGALARHPRARDDQVEARGLRADLTSWWTWE